MTTCCVQKRTGLKSFLRILLLFFFIATFFFIFPLTVCSVPAADVTLEWDENTEPDIAGYKVYYGLKSRNYSTTIDVGNFTSCVVSGLDSMQTYYFAATAYNTDGYESDYSNEVTYGASSSSPTASPSASDSGGGGGGCFIAAASYGVCSKPEVAEYGNSRIGGFLMTLWERIS